MKVSIDMGLTRDNKPATLDLEELLATRLLVQGNSGSGKSHLLRRLVEQSAQWVQQCLVDPEGDYVTLAEEFGHVVVDAAEHNDIQIAQIAARVRKHRVSVVLNLENLEAEFQLRRAAAFLNGMFEADRDFWYPCLVVVDEAQLFAPVAGGEVTDEARKQSLGAMTNLMCRGRKRGLAGVIATQRLAKLAKNVAAEASNFLMGRTFLDIDMVRAADLLGMDRRQAEMFRDLDRGNFIALGPALSRRPLPIHIGEVKTGGRGGSPKLMPLPETPPEDALDLIMTPGENEPPPQPARKIRPLPPKTATNDVLTQLAAARPLELEPEEENSQPADPAVTIERIMREVIADPDAAFRSTAVLYQDFLVRCRMKRINGRQLDLAAFKRKLATARAGVSIEAEHSENWEKAQSVADRLPEDLQPLFLLLARAAMDKAPCPSDKEIARARNSRSPRRARGLLEYLESRGVITQHENAGGLRVIALPDLEWETAPGDPRAGEELPVAAKQTCSEHEPLSERGLGRHKRSHPGRMAEQRFGETSMPPVEITFISDYVCPWCWLGRGRLARAVKQVIDAGILPAEGGIVLRPWPFELNPAMPADGMDRRTYRTAKFGSWEASQALDARILMQAREDGVPFAFDRITRTPSTKAAHRLTALVQHYHPSTLEAFLDAVFRAYFVEGRDIGDVNVLGQILVSVGLDRGLLLDRLRSGEATAAVEDMARQVRAAGVSGVPVFIIGETPFSGAQPIETLAQALTATAHTTRPDANHT